jgi:LacI family gluconate utilization system Gnt-I transcriptional repressor
MAAGPGAAAMAGSQTGALPPRRRSPTMQDVARALGVSTMTVSRALRDGTSVSAETRAAVRHAADALGYVFDSTAANLRRQRTGFVAVVIPSIDNANFADTVRALSTALAAQQLQPLLGTTDYEPRQEEALVEQMLRRRPEAIVVTGGQHTARCRRLLEGAHVPVVEIWDNPAAPIGHVVGFSNDQSAQIVVDHLVAQGFRRIAFLGGDAAGDARGVQRREGFVAAMRRHGLAPDRLVATGVPPVSMRSGALAARDLLARFADTEAVACVSDLAAFGVLSECQRRGIAVPDAVAIAGFGNFEIAGSCVPTLTTVDPAPHQIGRQAAAIVGRALAGGAGQESIFVEPVLIVRQSTER